MSTEIHQYELGLSLIERGDGAGGNSEDTERAIWVARDDPFIFSIIKLNTKTNSGVKAKKNPEPELFSGDGPGRSGAGRGVGGQHMQSMQWLWQLKNLKEYYGIVIAFLIQTDFFFHEYMVDLKNESYIIHLESYELYYRLSTLEVWQNTWDKMQILGSLEWDNILILFKKCSVTKYLSFNYKKSNNAVVIWNILTNLGL